MAVSGLGYEVAGPSGRLTVLRSVDFTIEAGETVAILGPSGAGKSTLLALLAGLELPTRGEVRLAGQSLQALDEDARARLRGEMLGFVFQHFQLIATLTALENVMLPLELLGRGDARERAEVVLAEVGLEARAGHYPGQLSGGEQQRVAIARAFAPGPRLLLADEPTGNLDAATGRRVMDLLFALNEKLGTTLVLVTHDEALAARCQRRLRLDGGELVAA